MVPFKPFLVIHKISLGLSNTHFIHLKYNSVSTWTSGENIYVDSQGQCSVAVMTWVGKGLISLLTY